MQSAGASALPASCTGPPGRKERGPSGWQSVPPRLKNTLFPQNSLKRATSPRLTIVLHSLGWPAKSSHLGVRMFRPPSLRPHQGPHHPGHLPHHHHPHHPHPPHKLHFHSHGEPFSIAVSLLLLAGGIVWLAMLGTNQVVGWFLVAVGGVNLIFRGK